jgi:hypothetical protein
MSRVCVIIIETYGFLLESLFIRWKCNYQNVTFSSFLKLIYQSKRQKRIHTRMQNADVKNTACSSFFYLKASSTTNDEILVPHSWLNSFSHFGALHETLSGGNKKFSSLKAR